MPARLSADRLPYARIAVPLVVFVYLAILRTRNITETFSMLGDQILYWRIALRPWHDLPIGGGPSSVGGTTPTAVLAVQFHSSAVFFAVPVIASLTIREWLARRRDRALRYAGFSAAVILLLETPFLVDTALHGVKRTSPEVVVANVSYTY